jgi:hypothetical protein
LRLIKNESQRLADWGDNFKDIVSLEQSYSLTIPIETFRPREITSSLLSSINLIKIAKGFRRDGISLIIKQFSKNEEEWNLFLSSFKQAAEEWKYDYDEHIDCHEGFDDDGNYFCYEDKPLDITPVYRILDSLKGRYEELNYCAYTNHVKSFQQQLQQPVSQDSVAPTTESVAVSYDHSFDGAFVRGLNCEAIKIALIDFPTSHYSKQDKTFWYIAFRVFCHLRWIVTPNKHIGYTKWVNKHFDCPIKENKLTKGVSKDLINNELEDWNKQSIPNFRNIIICRNLALDFINLFTQTIIDGRPQEATDFTTDKLMDKSTFFISGSRRINDYRN